jgi:hypothetical protein
MLSPRDLVKPVKSRKLIGVRVKGLETTQTTLAQGNHEVGLAVDLANLWMEFCGKMLVPRGQSFSQPMVSQLRYIRAYLRGSVRWLRATKGGSHPVC